MVDEIKLIVVCSCGTGCCLSQRRRYCRSLGKSRSGYYGAYRRKNLLGSLSGSGDDHRPISIDVLESWAPHFGIPAIIKEWKCGYCKYDRSVILMKGCANAKPYVNTRSALIISACVHSPSKGDLTIIAADQYRVIVGFLWKNGSVSGLLM